MTASEFSGYADLNGAPLHYQITGQGAPLLLIHAGIADSRMWYAQTGSPSSSVLRIAEPVALKLNWRDETY